MVVCKRCYAFAKSNEDIHAGILKHIEGMPEEIKCTDAIYQERLSQCESCEKLQNGMCAFCGCFVILRAIKKNQRCPYPKAPRW